MLVSNTEKRAFQFYDLLWGLALPFLRHNRRLAEGFGQRLFISGRPGPADIWIQAASVGEALLTRLLLERLNPPGSLNILVTANTRQGLDILAEACDGGQLSERGIHVTEAYFPFDRPSVMCQAVKHIQPKLMILLEAELWPAHLAALKKRGVHILVVNGRLTERSLARYRCWPSLWQRLAPDRILAMSDADGRRFAALFGGDRVEVISNLKFDRIDLTTESHALPNPLDPLLAPDAKLLVFGSIRKEEEGAIENIIRHVGAHRPAVVIGLFPRHTQRLDAWASILKRLHKPWCLRSQIRQPVAPGTVILWDTFGELVAAYRRCSAAFVGGSLAPLGGQNFLEAIASGIEPVIGPYWDNFAWVGVDLLKMGLFHVAPDWEKAAELLREYLDRDPNRRRVRQSVRHYFSQRRGGTEKACRLIEDYLRQTAGPPLTVAGARRPN